MSWPCIYWYTIAIAAALFLHTLFTYIFVCYGCHLQFAKHKIVKIFMSAVWSNIAIPLFLLGWIFGLDMVETTDIFLCRTSLCSLASSLFMHCWKKNTLQDGRIYPLWVRFFGLNMLCDAILHRYTYTHIHLKIMGNSQWSLIFKRFNYDIIAPFAIHLSYWGRGFPHIRNVMLDS